MGKLKTFYQTLSILSIAFGAILLISSQITIVGNVIKVSELSSGINVWFGLFFAVCGIALFIAQKADKKL